VRPRRGPRTSARRRVPVDTGGRLGACDQEGLDGLTSLAGLDALQLVQRFSIAGCDGLTSLAGAPALAHVNDLAVTDNPQLSPAAFETFVAEIASLPARCFNDECSCE
jgi:hypothetical protein